MSSSTRIYIATIGGKRRLVKASRVASVMMHVASDTIDVRVASQDELYAMARAGHKIENALAVAITHTQSAQRQEESSVDALEQDGSQPLLEQENAV